MRPHPLTLHVGMKHGQHEKATIAAMMERSGAISYSNLIRRALCYYADVLEVDLPAGVFDDQTPGQGGGRKSGQARKASAA